MKININSIPAEGLTWEEDILPSAWDLDTEIIKFPRLIKIKATIYKITNTISVDLALTTLIYLVCSRCLNGFETDFKKTLKLNYTVNKLEPIIDLDPDIREEIILDYPLKPLCIPDCKGLCPKCGKNLNEGDCSCAIT